MTVGPVACDFPLDRPSGEKGCYFPTFNSSAPFAADVRWFLDGRLGDQGPRLFETFDFTMDRCNDLKSVHLLNISNCG